MSRKRSREQWDREKETAKADSKDHQEGQPNQATTDRWGPGAKGQLKVGEDPQQRKATEGKWGKPKKADKGMEQKANTQPNNSRN